jgi:branched-chain amino acid transport system substrate-binding protein
MMHKSIVIRRKRMKKLLVVLLSLTMVVGLVGCTKKVEPAQGVTDTEILIANCAATSGPYSAVGIPFLAGIEAYLKYVNDAGGVDGRTIKFIHTDDEFNAEKGLACVNTMINDEKIFAFVGHFGTPVVAATLDTLKESGIPAVYFATGIGQLYAEKATDEDMNRNIMPVQPIYINEGKIMVARAKGDFNATKVGIIYTNDDAGKNMLEGAEAQAALAGVTLVKAQVEPGQADVSAAVTTIINGNVDFIIGAAIQATIPIIVKELANQNNTKDLITTYVNVSPAISNSFVREIAGKFDVYGSGWVSLVGEPNLTNYNTYAANISAEYAANAYAMTGWIAAYFFVEGLKRLEGEVPTWESYIDAMESAPISNPFGGVIDFADGQRTGTQEMNLSMATLTGDVAGWTVVEPLANIDTILGN